MKSGVLTTTLVLALMSSASVLAQDNTVIYGSQLMTQQERIEYRNQMRTLRTQEERNAFRLEHHKRMQERAAERGLSLPDSPPRTGAGMGPGPGGPGMGPGAGGRGRNQ